MYIYICLVFRRKELRHFSILFKLKYVFVFQTENVALAAYNTEWYRITPNVRYGLWIMMIRNQKPKFMIGFGFIYASNETFLNVSEDNISDV